MDDFDSGSGFDDIAPLGDDTPEYDAPLPAEPVDGEAMLRSAKQPLNDYGNGQRFVIHYGSDVMFVPRVGWFIWNGRVWEKDADQLDVRRRAQGLSDVILREIPHLQFGKDRAAQMRADLSKLAKTERTAEQAATLDSVGKLIGRHRSFANTTGNSARIDNATKEAGTALAWAFDDLDAGPQDVNTESGVLRFSVIDMSAEGSSKVARVDVIPHERDQRLTKIMPVTYDPAAPHPLFDAFLERVQPDRDMREFLKRWLGLSMTGIKMQRLAFFYGGGANGKSVLVDLIARILGNYAATARIESLTGTNRRGGGEATPDLIPLMGARMVRTSEPDEGQRLQEGLIKELTGGEPIMMRALHSDFIEVRPEFKMTMSGNHKPEIRGTDDGIWRRVMLVPFDVQIPEAERDSDLVNKLWEERSGILNWLAEGLIDVLEGGLAPPDKVLDATREYREESDPIGVFLTSCCVVTGDPTDLIPSKELGDAFTLHLLERGLSAWKPATFAKQIAAKSRHWQHPETGKQFQKGKASVTQYLGLRLTDAFDRRFRDAPRDHNGRPIGASTASPRPE